MQASAAPALHLTRRRALARSVALAPTSWRALALTPSALLAACAPLPRARPPGPPIVAAAAWGGEPVLPPAGAQRVSHLTVHHQGETWQAGAPVPAYLQRLQRWSRQAKGWPDLPYHYIVAPDGTVYAGRHPALPGDTQTEYDPRGHLQVMLLGNFEHQQPTPAQWQATVGLLAHLLAQHGLQPDAIGAHRHHSTQTVCPGENLYKRFDDLRRAAASAARP